MSMSESWSLVCTAGTVSFVLPIYKKETSVQALVSIGRTLLLLTAFALSVASSDSEVSMNSFDLYTCVSVFDA